MENYRRDGYEGRENRRDYGRENNQERSYTGSYSQAGRKLRHRKNSNISDGTEGYSSYSDRKRSSYSGEKNSYGSSERRSSGYSDRKSFGSGRSYGEGGRTYGNRRPAGRSYGDNDQRRGSSDNYQRRSFGEGGEQRRSFGGRPSGRRTFSDGRRGGDNRGRRPGAAAGRPMRRQQDSASAGINRMLSRKPILNDNSFSDNDLINIPVKEEVRLNKFIANSGVCSRREADNLILAGVVTVNGEVVTELGTKVNIKNDDIRFNGERLKGEEKVYIVMNKPKGYVTTASDPHADKTVMELLKGCEARVFPVGRLDKNTTGVLMFTNDGEIAEKLTHPSYDKKKIYQVSLDKDLSQEDFEHIMNGIELTDGVIAADELEYIDDTDRRKLGIEIHSGKNRIVRRIFESLGYTVKALDRVYFAGLTKKGLKRGAWRYLSTGETNVLKMGAYN